MHISSTKTNEVCRLWYGKQVEGWCHTGLANVSACKLRDPGIKANWYF